MAAAEGPWSPGLSSTIPDRLMPRVTLYDPQNSTVGWDEARGLSEVTGLSQQLLATFRPERLALHHVLIRVMGELYVPDGPIYADLGINLRKMVSEIYLHHVVPSLEHIAADHGQLCREAEAIIMGELSDAVLTKPPASAPLRGFLGRRIRNRPAGPVSSRDERAFDYVDRWSGGGAADDLHSQCRGALSRTIGAILSRRGELLVDQGALVPAIRLRTLSGRRRAGGEKNSTTRPRNVHSAFPIIARMNCAPGRGPSRATGWTNHQSSTRSPENRLDARPDGSVS